MNPTKLFIALCLCIMAYQGKKDYLTSLLNSSNTLVSGTDDSCPENDDDWSEGYKMYENQGEKFYPFEFKANSNAVVLKFTPKEERIVKIDTESGTVVTYMNKALPLYLIEGRLADKEFLQLTNVPRSLRIQEILQQFNKITNKDEGKVAQFRAMPISSLGSAFVFEWPGEQQYLWRLLDNHEAMGNFDFESPINALEDTNPDDYQGWEKAINAYIALMTESLKRIVVSSMPEGVEMKTIREFFPTVDNIVESYAAEILIAWQDQSVDVTAKYEALSQVSQFKEDILPLFSGNMNLLVSFIRLLTQSFTDYPGNGSRMTISNLLMDQMLQDSNNTTNIPAKDARLLVQMITHKVLAYATTSKKGGVFGTNARKTVQEVSNALAKFIQELPEEISDDAKTAGKVNISNAGIYLASILTNNFGLYMVWGELEEIMGNLNKLILDSDFISLDYALEDSETTINLKYLTTAFYVNRIGRKTQSDRSPTLEYSINPLTLGTFFRAVDSTGYERILI